jgi:hypothetical protein
LSFHPEKKFRLASDVFTQEKVCSPLQTFSPRKKFPACFRRFHPKKSLQPASDFFTQKKSLQPASDFFSTLLLRAGVDCFDFRAKTSSPAERPGAWQAG